MKPHMQYIAQTLARKKAADDASDYMGSYQTYNKLACRAFEKGYSVSYIIQELEEEKERIEMDRREGDELFQQGLRNAKAACLKAIDLLISELKGDKNV